MFKTLLKRSATNKTLDYHVGFTILHRAWMALAGSLISAVIPFYLTAQEQGYYFSFNSVIALQVFFELGLSFVVMQMFAHEMANVTFSNDGQLTGPDHNIVKIKSLFKLMLRWYSFSAVIFAIVIIPSGYYFFKLNGPLETSKWLAPWTSLAIFTAINLFISPLLAACEGMGMVGEVARLRLAQSIISTLIIIGLLKLGYGLFIAPIGACISVIVSFYWLFKNRLWLKPLLFNKVNHQHINWKTEILPFQWRIAISWLSGYFIFQMFAPVFFIFQGPETAGKIGFCISIFSTINVLSLSWISANIPNLVKYISHSDRPVLNTKFQHLFRLSLATYILLASLAICVVTVLSALKMEVVTRIVPLNTLLSIAIIFAIQQIISALALYVRSHREEPFVFNSILTAILFFLSLTVGGRYSMDMALLLCIISNIISLMVAWLTFKRYYSLET